jgi:hypothetical protein
MSPKPRNPIVLRQGQNIGEPAAEDDDDYLFTTFFENYAYKTISEVEGPKFLLAGRTGTGKTAILRRLERDCDHVIRIDPAELSLQYISNSDIIRFFENAGVKLDLFYQLLWRHVIATELIKYHFKLEDEHRTRQFFVKVSGWFNSKRKRALEYMQSFGSDFWLETDARITQVTQKFEAELNSSLGVTGPVKSEVGGRVFASEEQKKDVIARAQKVVDNVHLQQLSEVIEWLNDDVFHDDKRPHYVLIDDLDLNFASGATKLWLIRALIETCKKFKKVSNVKIVVAMRSDLLERVFEMTRDEGFQEEKYKGNILNIEWLPGELKEIVDRRLKESIRRQYSQSKLGFSDIFPDRMNQGDGFAYMIQRTLHRPRDIIAFVNECISQAVGSDRVTSTAMRKAEEPYSTDRFNALRDEWRGQYPLLDRICRPLIGRPRRFPVHSFSSTQIEDLMLDLATAPNAESDRLGAAALKAGSYGNGQTSEFMIDWLDALYKVGVLGVKTDPGMPVKWNYRGRQTLNSSDVNSESVLYVHPMLWRRLAISTKEQDTDGDES